MWVDLIKRSSVLLMMGCILLFISGCEAKKENVENKINDEQFITSNIDKEQTEQEIQEIIKEEESRGRIALEGKFFSMTDEEIIEEQAISDLNSVKFQKNSQKTLIFKLNQPQELELMEKNGEKHVGKVSMIGFDGAVEKMDNLGKNVVIMINPDETYWSSDGILPLDEPITMHYLLVNQGL